MKLLVIGGAGYVGAIVLPFVAARHTLRVFDRQPPAAHRKISAGRCRRPRRAGAGRRRLDALLYMAMGDKNYATNLGITSNFDVNVKGLYLALDAAQRVGIGHAVYASGMLVYQHNLENRPHQAEDLSARRRATCMG